MQSTAAVVKPPWNLIDIGINLTSEMYLGNYHHGEGSDAHTPDIVDVVRRAELVGVGGMLITGGTLDESKHAIRLAQQFTSPTMQCLATVGCHPTRCNEFDRFSSGPDGYLAALSELIEGHSVRRGATGVVAAIGECGLDYDRLHFCKKEVQQKYFRAQFALAKQHRLPMFLHNRNTDGDFVEMVRAHRSDFTEGVVHSFTGSKAEMVELIELGLFIGVNGCSLKTEENVDVVKHIPLDRLLLETDAPYCDIRSTHAGHKHTLAKLGNRSVSQQLLSAFPQVKKEKFAPKAMVKGRNEPANLVEVLEVVYELRREELGSGVSINDFAAIIQKNTARLFGFE